MEEAEKDKCQSGQSQLAKGQRGKTSFLSKKGLVKKERPILQNTKREKKRLGVTHGLLEKNSRRKEKLVPRFSEDELPILQRVV